MTPRQRGGRLRRITAYAALAAALTGLVAALVSHQREDVVVTAVFADASPLYPGNVVKAAGVTVGDIESIALVNGLAQVRMRVETSVLPLHTDARATITEQDLLGERYVALERGTPSAPLLDPARPVIPQNNTARSVDLQSILNGVDNPTGTALAALVTTLGEGADHQGADIAAGLEALRPAMRQTDELGRVLSEQNALLAHLVDTAQPVLGALAADNGHTLDNLVGSADKTLGAVAADRDALRDTLSRLPGTLGAAQRTLAQVAGVADNATPTLASLRPVTRDLRDISGELHRFSDSADPALASLRPVLERGQKLIDEAAPVADALRSAGPDIRGAAAGGRRFVRTALSGPALADLMEFAKNWALITNGYDGLSNYFRVAALATPKALGTTGAGPVPGLPDAPIPGIAAPALPLPAPMAPAPGQHGHPSTRDGGATGMNEQQENNLMDQLLGGR